MAPQFLGCLDRTLVPGSSCPKPCGSHGLWVYDYFSWGGWSMFPKRKEVLLHQVMAGEAGHVHICEILAGRCWGWYRSVWRSGGIETWKMWDWHQEHPGTPGSNRHSCSLILLRSIILLGPTIFLKVMGLLIVNMIVSYCARWRKVMLSTINFLLHNVQDAAATRPSMSRHVRRLKRNVVFHTVLAHNLSHWQQFWEWAVLSAFHIQPVGKLSC
jgi:hypothetical protein